MVNVPFFSKVETKRILLGVLCFAKRRKRVPLSTVFRFPFSPLWLFNFYYSFVIFIPYLKLTEESRKIIYDWHGFR
jgi:hypothetical protein